MKFLKRNILTILSLALIAVFAFSGDAFAQQTTSVMTTAKDKLYQVFQAVKTIVFVLGGFGLMVLAFLAIFGKMKWTNFALLGFGLAILAAAGSIVEYVVGSGVDSGTSGFSDSFDKAAK